MISTRDITQGPQKSHAGNRSGDLAFVCYKEEGDPCHLGNWAFGIQEREFSPPPFTEDKLVIRDAK